MAREYSQSRIGIDLDNTIIGYDRLFHEMALTHGLIPTTFVGSKREIRDHIRKMPEGDFGWQRLQAIVYGPAIGGATPADGALEFIRHARKHGAELTIVSHKTAWANMGTTSVNLRDAAREWLRGNGFVGDDSVPEGNLYFETTRSEKIARIRSLRCTHFIDDLEEVFNDESFPVGVERMLLAGASTVPAGPYTTFTSFREIADVFVAD